MDEKTQRAIDKMLGIREYGTIFWIEDADGNRILERRTKIKAKTYDEAYKIGKEEYDKFQQISAVNKYRGQMEKSKFEYGE